MNEKAKTRPAGEPAESFWSRAQFFTCVGLVLFAMFVAFLWPRMLITIPAGHRGVMFYRWTGGTVTDRVWDEGLHVIAPWNTLNSYETRLQQRTMDIKVLSAEGLNMGVAVSVRFNAIDTTLGYLHQDVGPDYFDRLIRPEVEAHLRRTFGARTVHEIYTSARDLLQEASQVTLLGKWHSAVAAQKGPEAGSDISATPYINLEELKILYITLPKVVSDAINEKHRQEQLLLEYDFRLKREGKEADRKRTEAAGVRDYNLIAGRISASLLRWRAVEASFELARSTNAKVVVLGGQGGVPMILNFPDQPGGADQAAADQPAANLPAPQQGAAPPPLPGGPAAAAGPPAQLPAAPPPSAPVPGPGAP